MQKPIPVPAQQAAQGLGFVITATVVGTIIDWYDFFVFASLASIISIVFFPSADPAASLLLTFAAFGVGFLGRPLGGVVFGRLGDKIGRKYAFLVTIITMGAATSLIGAIPSYASIGIVAPSLVFLLRIIQGMGVGGEYGGAFVYIAENAPEEKRGFYGSFVQIAGSLGFVLSLILTQATRLAMGASAFNAYGWRYPFVYSLILVLIGIYLRFKLEETPFYSELRKRGKTTQSPLYESFTSLENWKLMIIGAVFGSAGIGVTFYTSNIYSFSFLTSIAKLDLTSAQLAVAIGLILGLPFVPLFGYLSDKIGRKPLMLTGFLISAILYLPIFNAMLSWAKSYNIGLLAFGIFIIQFFMLMEYAPMPAWFAEYFRGNIRYTSVNFSWNLGVILGGFQPFIATALVAYTHSPLGGLYYSVAVPIISFIVGLVFYKESKGTKIWKEIQ